MGRGILLGLLVFTRKPYLLLGSYSQHSAVRGTILRWDTYRPQRERKSSNKRLTSSNVSTCTRCPAPPIRWQQNQPDACCSDPLVCLTWPDTYRHYCSTYPARTFEPLPE
jgi:hypothetical protein